MAYQKVGLMDDPMADLKVRPTADRWVCLMAVLMAYRRVG